MAASLLLAAALTGCIEEDGRGAAGAGAQTGDAGPGGVGAGTAGTAGSAGGAAGSPAGSDGASGSFSGAGGLGGAGVGGSTVLDAAVAGADAGGAGGSAGMSGSGAGAGGQDGGADAFVPGPAEPIEVNSGETASYSLNDGEWKLFYFEAEAGQAYTVSPLSGIVRGYLSTSADVSPDSYQYATDEVEGTVSFVAAETGRHYIAVVVDGGGASGWFQVADGGRSLSLGANSVSLQAPNSNDTSFFHFPITAGAAYEVQVQGPADPEAVISAAPRPERSLDNQFFHGAWGLSGHLPLGHAIEALSVSQSTSGFYYLSLKVFADMNVTITLTQQ
jgi:hypothetical protein